VGAERRSPLTRVLRRAATRTPLLLFSLCSWRLIIPHSRVSPKRRRRRRIPSWILRRLMRLAWPRKISSRARKFSKSNPPSEPVVRVEFYVAFSGSRDPVRFWKEVAFLGRILPKNSLGRAAWSEKNRSSPPFLVSSFFSLMFLSIFS